MYCFVDYPPCVVSQSQCMPGQTPSCTTGQNQLLTCSIEAQPTATTSICKTEQQCAPNTAVNQQCQVALGLPDYTYHVASSTKLGVGCVGKQIDTISRQICDNSVHQQNLHSPADEDYSYPNLRVEWLQGCKHQYTAANS